VTQDTQTPRSPHPDQVSIHSQASAAQNFNIPRILPTKNPNPRLKRHRSQPRLTACQRALNAASAAAILPVSESGECAYPIALEDAMSFDAVSSTLLIEV
jgi:hypothetical protein